MENKEIQAFAGINNEYVPFGNFLVQKPENQEVKESSNFIGYDYMVKFNVPYQNRVNYPIRASLFFEDLCNQVGLEAGDLNFVNADYMILGNPFTNNEDCREVLSQIAQLAGGFAKIGRDNKVYIVTLQTMANLLKVKDVHQIEVLDLNDLQVNMLGNYSDKVQESIDGNNYFTDFSKNEQYGEVNSLVLSISQVEGENSTIQDDESIQENGLTEIKIEDNSFLIEQVEREKVIEPLWNSLKGLTYTPFSTKYYGFPYIDTGDCICIIDINDNQYITYVLNHTFTFNGTFNGELNTPALTKTETKYKNITTNKSKFKRVEFQVDKINGRISQIINEQTETEDRVSEVEQTVDALTTKVNEVADITDSKETAFGTLQFENINHSEPLEIKINPVGVNIAYTYPRNNLYPSDELFMTPRIIRFENTTTEEIFDYEIPDDLLYYDENNYDEFTLDYESKTCSIHKKVGYNADGTVYKLVTPRTDTYDYPTIELSDGNYTVSLPSYNNAYLYVKLMIQNQFTTIFASKVDVKTEIKQTADAIDMEVSKKVGEDEIISKINQSAETIAINARKISLEGYTTINRGFTIDENGNASIANGTVSIDDRGILLADGASVLGGNGLLSNLQFFGKTYHFSMSTQAGSFDSIGFEVDDAVQGGVYPNLMMIAPDIPDNFTIVSAKVSLKHCPAKLYGLSSQSDVYGYARKLKLYVQDVSATNYSIPFAIYGSMPPIENEGMEIINAFGRESFTPSVPTRTSQKLETIESIDVSEYVKDTDTNTSNIFIIMSTDTPPAYTGDPAVDYLNCAYKTGIISAVLDVYGYLKL